MNTCYFITDTLSCFTLIRLSCSYFGQNSRKFSSIIFFLILGSVLFLHIRHKINLSFFILLLQSISSVADKVELIKNIYLSSSSSFNFFSSLCCPASLRPYKRANMRDIKTTEKMKVTTNTVIKCPSNIPVYLLPYRE